jgi:hypothetical protein
MENMAESLPVVVAVKKIAWTNIRNEIFAVGFGKRIMETERHTEEKVV